MLDCDIKGNENPTETDTNKVKLNKCILFAANNKGHIFVIDLNVTLSDIDIPFAPSSSSRHNYNAFRTIQADFNDEVLKLQMNIKKIINISKTKPQIGLDLKWKKNSKSGSERKPRSRLRHFEKSLLIKFRAHKDMLTSLSLVTI